MPTIAAFNTHLQAMLNLGTTITSPTDFLTVEINKAFRFFERNHNFLYMELFRTFTTTANQATVALTAFTKRIEMLREVRSNGTFFYWDKIHPTDLDRKDPHDVGGPLFVFLDGQQATALPQLPQIRIINPVAELLNMEMIELVFTDWANVATSVEPWLLRYAEDLMTYQVIRQVALLPIVRDRDLAQDMEQMRAEALSTVLAADDELRASITSNEMRYGRSQ